MWSSRKTAGPVEWPDVPWAVETVQGYAAVSGPWSWEYGHFLDTVVDAEEIRDYLLRTIYGAFANAKRKEPEKYADYDLGWVPYVAAKRESRRLIGDYILTETDVRSARSFPDAVASGSWPIDLHYPQKGLPFRTAAKMDPVKPYPIPFRCLYSRNIENLMMAGRDISVTHVALGSTRVMNTGGQEGVAAGAGAHLAARYGITPRRVYEQHLEELLTILRVRLGRTTVPGVESAPPAWLQEAGPNVALSARVAVSSCLDPAKYPPSAINDGKTDTARNEGRWVSASGAVHTVELRWDAAQTIGAARITSGWFRGGAPADPNRDFVLLARRGDEWQEIAGTRVVNNNRVQWSAEFPAVMTDGIRMVVTAGSKSLARLWELELYGPVPRSKPAGD
jgi:hypothetical protein